MAQFFALTGAAFCSDNFSPSLFDLLLGLLTVLSHVFCGLLARFLSRPLAQVFNQLLAWFCLSYRKGPSSFPCPTTGSVSCSTPCSEFRSTSSLVLDRQSGRLLLTFSVFARFLARVLPRPVARNFCHFSGHFILSWCSESLHAHSCSRSTFARASGAS